MPANPRGLADVEISAQSRGEHTLSDEKYRPDGGQNDLRMSDRRENISWLVGVLVSGIVHVGAGVGAARYGTLFVADGMDRNGEAGTPIDLLAEQDEVQDREEAAPPPPPPLLEPPPVDPETRERLMRLGIRESSQNTDAWLGFNEPGEHSGVLSSLDQAQLALEPGEAGMPGDAAAASGESTPQTSEAQSQPQPDESASPMQISPPAKPLIAPQQPSPQDAPQNPDLPDGPARPGDAKESGEAAPSDAGKVVPGPTPREGKDPQASEVGDANREAALVPPIEALKLPEGVMVGPVEVRDDALLPAALPIGVAPLAPPAGGAAPKPEILTPQPKTTAVSSPASSAATPAPTPPATSAPQTAASDAGSANATPGNKADREADAASKKGPIEVRPGKPAAGQGLEIQTVRPKWSITVQLTSVPKNPMVRIVFGPDGKVKNAAFVLGQDTGSAEVDGPLLDAIYRWTAKGKAIDQLPKNDPKAGVPLIMRIVLRG